MPWPDVSQFQQRGQVIGSSQKTRMNSGSRKGHAIEKITAPTPALPRKRRAIAYDQLQPCVATVVASHDLSAGRPCERRDPSPQASKVKKGLCSSAETRF